MIEIFGHEEGKQLTARNINIIKEIAERTQLIGKTLKTAVPKNEIIYPKYLD